MVTGGDGSIVATLDGTPALEVLKQDIGEILARDLRRIAGYIHVGLSAGKEDDGFMVHPLWGVDLHHGRVALGVPVASGEALVFVRRDPSAAQNDLRRTLRVLRQRTGGLVRGALYFSCVGRVPSLFGGESAELAMIRTELGDIPLTGFYANGEIRHNRLYGYTGVLTLFL
ncbi:MAG: hypothetical protein FD149_2317 [Rhodospirillaceae bacterium]|nr:MAG: hypothetical protein FD149_2317 [Rhodospirillaceae bacterium]